MSPDFDPAKRQLLKNTLLVAIGAGTASMLAACEQRPKSNPPDKGPEKHPTSYPTNQLEQPLPEVAISALERSPNENVQGLGDLEKRCKRPGMFTGVMQFLDVSTADARNGQAAGLYQSVEAGLRPISVLDLDNLDLANLHKGPVDAYFDTLFGGLQHADVKPDQLGPFALCPEFIAGFSGQPEDYAPDLNLFLNSLGEAAPNAPASNMIDLSEANALMPTLQNVHTDFLKTVGIQAFANGGKIPFDQYNHADVSGFLKAEKIKQVVNALSIGGDNPPIWINTGIIREDANLGVKYSVDQRIAIAGAIAGVVNELKNDGVQIEFVNLFAQNKLDGKYASDNAERRDFSFHPGDEPILEAFYDQMKLLKVSLSGFALPHDIAKSHV